VTPPKLCSSLLGDSTFAPLGPWLAEHNGTLRIFWPTLLPLFLPTHEEYLIGFPAKTQCEFRSSRFIRYFVFPSYAHFQNAFEIVCGVHSDMLPGLCFPSLDAHSSPGRRLGRSVYGTPRLPYQKCEFSHFPDSIGSHGKVCGLISWSKDPAICSFVQDPTHSGYYMMRMIMRHAGHPYLRDSL
jgi:hypothetical protein